MAEPAGKRRVLLIDDSEPIRHFFVDLVTRAGFDGAAAASGREGLAVLASWRPHAVVLDVELPDGDGLELLREMRRDPNCPPVVIWSGVPEAVARAKGLGAVAALPKPCRADALLEILTRWCR